MIAITPRVRLFLYCSTFLLQPAITVECQTSKEYVITEQRSGSIQFRDPATLDVISRIDFDLVSGGAGLNGIFSDPSGTTLYIEGPSKILPNEPAGCCGLYSLDLLSGKAANAAGIWGSASRLLFISSGPSQLRKVSDSDLTTSRPQDDRWQVSPDGRWWAGLRSGPSIDFYDPSHHKIVRSLTAPERNPDWYLNGAWIDDQFYIYSAHDGAGWLWHVSPESASLDEPAQVPGPSAISGCETPAITQMSAVGNHLVAHEVFGSKTDRRHGCQGVQGGAWIIDPASNQAAVNFAPQLYFWQLIPSLDGASLYGITSESFASGAPAQILRLDSHSGKILQAQLLEADYWWIATANLGTIALQNRTVELPLSHLLAERPPQQIANP